MLHRPNSFLPFYLSTPAPGNPPFLIEPTLKNGDHCEEPARISHPEPG